MLVDLERDRLAAAAGAGAREDLHRYDLIGESPTADRVRSPPLAFERERVLHLASDAVAGGHIFRRDTHVNGVPRIVEHTHQIVHQRGMAHASTPSGRGHQIRTAAHGFGAATDRDVRVAQLDRLRGGQDRLQAGATETVDVEGRCLLRDAGVDRGHARQIRIPRFGGDDIAHDDVTDGLGRDARTFERCADDGGAQRGERDVFQRSAKRANRGAGSPDNEDGRSTSSHLICG